MQKSSIRRAAMAMTALSAALVVTACQPGGSDSGAKSPSKAPTGTASSSPAPSATASTPSATATPKAPPVSASPISTGSTGTAVKTCAATALKAIAYQATDRPEGTGTGAAIVQFSNTTTHPCTLQGHPTVAGAANGSPDHNAPLKVTPTGSAAPVKLAPGGQAWVKLTFVQVQGEGDGYCKSGSTPVSYPTMVIGLPGSGAYQVALDDGVLAECDNTVTATAVTAVKPS
jgi:hypothetical protein